VTAERISGHMPSEPAHDWPRDQGAAGRAADATWATLAYLGAVFLGPLIPLAVYLTRRNRSPFMRYHAARALNISVTAALYLVCCAILGGMLALDTVAVALAVSLTLVFVLWLIMLRHLVRGVVAANHGEPFEVPSWLCATIVS
jgi:uncharacterized Tic20 family protein